MGWLAERLNRWTGEMPDDFERLQRKIEELNWRLLAVEEHLFGGGDSVVEAVPPAPSSPDRSSDVRAFTADVPASDYIAWTGRSLIVLGGAFFLRWLTQSGIVPQAAGIVLGIAYALLWLATADVTGGRGKSTSAVFHGVTAAFIAFPLLVETTTKFHYLGATGSAAALTLFICFGLVVSARRRLDALAWIVTLPVVPLAFLLSIRTAVMTPFLAGLLVIAFVTLWLGYLRRWQILATLIAGVANLGLAIMIVDRYLSGFRRQDYQPALWEALGLLFGMIALYFGSYCFRVFMRKRTITALEIGQTLVAILIGLGGATLYIHYERQPMLLLGIGCLVLSAAGYTAAYGFLPRRDPNRRNFIFFTLLALAMGLLGCELTFPVPTAALVFSAVALVAGALAYPITSPVLFIHGAVYLIMAIVRSQLAETVLHAFMGPPVMPGGWTHPVVITALCAAIVYLFLPRPDGRRNDLYLGRRAVDLFLFVVVLSTGGVLVSIAARGLAFGLDTVVLDRSIAPVRTGVLALAAVLLSRFHYRTRFGNLAWLVYVILVLAAARLLIEDVTAGGAATLFLSFGLYGGALILAPRMLGRTGKHPDSSKVDGQSPG